MNRPPVVSAEEWQTALQQQVAKEKALTRALDALAAKRRRLPMVEMGRGYVFEGPEGKASLPDLFDGRRQLVVYHFMLEPGTEDPCSGCSSLTDNVGNLAHLRARDTNFVLVSRAPLSELQPFKERMGWTVPWYSTYGGPDFNGDCGANPGFGLSVFLRDGDDVFRTYYTTSRGVDRLRLDFNLLDLTPYGRQETWEDSPAGWPQTPAYEWWRLHDEYDD
ncbi:hypothetical protein Misp01_09210 [Microtetraspora sp. NBRC 13810]|uniref:DUF899 domain-containing protein n=1 Tax=Microtetraspora sp. NBRC 13810 TaxID=3030990 RepID=UPI0024A3AAA8|nr:DUF899 domain-containing protein [Microtetraspora sp. NBRC 13810]GLW05791.1 hypothetical protein Misp01_09210 [Microtetraspora sp. NBRC 13810]